MDFKENKAIYLQIAERICDEILQDKYKEEERVPSREYAAIVEVNFNTVMRTFEYLQSQEVIYNKRGIGYFVSTDAKKLILKARKDTFMKEELNNFFKQVYTLDIPMEEIAEMYKEYNKKQSK